MVSKNALSTEDRALVDRYEAAGQGHVFRFLDRLDLAAAQALVDQARGIDLDLVSKLAAGEDTAEIATKIDPPGTELIRMRDGPDYVRLRNAARERGLDELRQGRVAVVIAAGGQGTRLGSLAPKAMWPVGPTSGKPLLQWLAEKVKFWTNEIGRPIPIVLMVSDATARPTHDFLRWHAHFGLDPTWIRTACQDSLPPVDERGKLVLADRGRIALSPNGHGGVYQTLAGSGALDLLEDHGVRTLSYVQVDNPLIRPVDPVFLGFHDRGESLISSKSVLKRTPEERVGVFARVGGRSRVVEYTELTVEQSRAVQQDGSLLFGQGSIAAHCIDLGFARRMATEGLPYHRAHKRVPYVDEDGNRVEPAEPNAYKFERFLFDAIPLAARSLVVETDRAREFSPIKNATGDDSPDSARGDLCALFGGWYARADLDVPEGLIEVDPSIAPDERAFRAQRGLSPQA